MIERIGMRPHIKQTENICIPHLLDDIIDIIHGAAVPEADIVDILPEGPAASQANE